MKISRQDRSVLVLQHRLSNAMRLFLIPIVSIFAGGSGLGIAATIETLGTIDLSCHKLDRLQIACEKRESRMLGFIDLPKKSFDRIRSANFRQETQTHRDSEGTSTTTDNWISFTTTNDLEITAIGKEGVFINGYRGVAADFQEITNTVNSFIKSDRLQLEIHKDNRLNISLLMQHIPHTCILLIFTAFSCTALFILFVYIGEDFTFDRQLSLFTKTTKTIWGDRSVSYPLGTISGVTIKTDTGGESISYSLQLLPISIYQNLTLPMDNLQQGEVIRSAIGELLNLPQSNR